MKYWVHYPFITPRGNYGWYNITPPRGNYGWHNIPPPREKLTIPSYQLTPKFVHTVMCPPLQVLRRALGGQMLIVAVDGNDTRLSLLGGGGTPQA